MLKWMVPTIVAIVPVTAQAQNAAKTAPPPAFAPCAMCHSVTKDGAAKIGPTLAGVVGRQSGSVAGYTYSPAMKAAKIRWSAAEFASFLAAPAKRVPGTKMMAVPVTDARSRAAIIGYLSGLQ